MSYQLLVQQQVAAVLCCDIAQCQLKSEWYMIYSQDCAQLCHMSMDRHEDEVDVWHRHKYRHRVASVVNQLSGHTSSCSQVSCVEAPSALCPTLLIMLRVENRT